MLDIKNRAIRVGDKVKTTQPSGGIFSPAKPCVGIVELGIDSFGNNTLYVRYKKYGKDFYSFIDLNGKLNEIL